MGLEMRDTAQVERLKRQSQTDWRYANTLIRWRTTTTCKYGQATDERCYAP